MTLPPGIPDVYTGGGSSALGVTAATVVKAGPGAIARLIVIAPGSAGALTLNDTASLASASATNEVYSAPYTALTSGQIITLEWPCGTGIALSAVPTGAQLSVSYF